MARPWCGAGSVRVAHVPLGPKLMHLCRAQKVDAKEHGNILKIMLMFEEAMAPDRHARGGKLKRIREKSCQGRVHKASGGV